jgi:hypothetical protein
MMENTPKMMAARRAVLESEWIRLSIWGTSIVDFVGMKMQGISKK